LQFNFIEKKRAHRKDFNSNIGKVTGDFGRENDQQQIKNKDLVDPFLP